MILGPSKTHDVETGTSSSSSRPVQIVCDQKPPATAGRGRRAAATTRKKKGEKDAPEGDGSVARRPKTRRKKKNVVPEDDPRGSGSESRQPLPGQPRRRRMPAQQQHPPEFNLQQIAVQPAEPHPRREPQTAYPQRGRSGVEPQTAHPQRGRSQKPPRVPPAPPTQTPAPPPAPVEEAPGSQEVRTQERPMFARPLIKAAALAKQLSAASLNSGGTSPSVSPPAPPVPVSTTTTKKVAPVVKTQARGGAKRKADPATKATAEAKRAKTGKKDSASKNDSRTKKKSPSPDPLQPSLDGWVTKTPRKKLAFNE